MAEVKPMAENIQMNMELVAVVAPGVFNSERGLIIILMEVAADTKNQMLVTELVVVEVEAQVDQIQKRARVALMAVARVVMRMEVIQSKMAKMDSAILGKLVKE